MIAGSGLGGGRTCYAGGGRRAAGGAGRRARRWRDVRGVRRALLANLVLTLFGSGLRVLSFCQLRQALGDVCRMRETGVKLDSLHVSVWVSTTTTMNVCVSLCERRV